MDERRLDAGVAEVVTGLLHLRRTLDPATYLDLLGAIMVEIEEGKELVLERAHRQPAGNVVPFTGTERGSPSNKAARPEPTLVCPPARLPARHPEREACLGTTTSPGSNGATDDALDC